MDWIKMSDRVPESSNDEVIIFTTDGNVYTGFRFYEPDKCFMDEMDAVFEQEEVTHWMKLPMPPKD